MRITPEIQLTLNDVSKAIGEGNKSYGDIPINAISTDSRTTYEGDLFIPLKGTNTDGEGFVCEAKAKGAYVISASYQKADFKTNDTRTALLSLAAYYKELLKRLRYTIAITGSTGKTTTKNILSGLLKEDYKEHHTHENYNNIIGLAHTILTAPKNTEILICELGMNHAGEIALLSRFLKPTLGIITNIGSSHLGNLGTRQDIAKAKLEILCGMQSPKLIGPYGEALIEKNISYSFSVGVKNADCYISVIQENENGSIFDIRSKNVNINSQSMHLPGQHILKDLAASISAIDLLDLDVKNISKAISSLTHELTRGRFITAGSYTVYDDSYSASPEAVISDFELSLHWQKEKVCVLGDMLELGTNSIAMHSLIGKKALEYGFKKLFAFGRYAYHIASGAYLAGMPKENIFVNTDISSPEITARQIKENVDHNSIILVKASHAIHAERLFPFLGGRIQK